MKAIKDIYAEDIDENGYITTGDYDPLINSFNFEIILQVDDEDYQGDSRVLYKDKEKIGLLIFGWGSCSGCDAIQACNTIKDVEELQKGLLEDIKWFDNKKEAYEYFKNHDWEGDFTYSDVKTEGFVKECLEYLSK